MSSLPLKRKCVFLDRDGVLNEDRPDYVYQLDHFKIMAGVPLALQQLKDAGFLLLVVTNQAGISKGIYTQQDMEKCHRYLQEQCGGLIDHFYFSPYHPTISESLGRKPGSLLFEKGIARYNIDPTTSWMIGDRERDLIPARLLGTRTIQIGAIEEKSEQADYSAANLITAAQIIFTH
ncbi:MAG TPA: D,D-heptose 1,7-bisphosphate phosphatase [Cytophagales bacterium]|nr:D,D-heptose 1,7-bisphosphate phosphatase [Cytophagales bacterium]